MISEKFFPENGTNDWKAVSDLCIRCAQKKYGIILPAADEDGLSGPTSLCRERFTFKELLSSRDDVMFWYMKHGHDRKEAYRLCRAAAFSGCYGYGDLDSLNNDDEEDQLNFPSDMGCYLLPKAHLVDDMANLLRLVWYETRRECMKTDFIGDFLHSRLRQCGMVQ